VNRDERHRAVLDLLAEYGRIEVDDLVTRLAVSPATARRDLDQLAAQQLLTRTRGGAVAHSVAYDLPLRYKRERRATQKEAIGRAAAAMVGYGAVVGLSGGTTTTAVGEALATRPDLAAASAEPTLTIVTNAINIAAQLAMRPQLKTVVTGGVVHPRSYELTGPYGDLVLQRLTLDIAFVGINGIDPETGPTVHHEGEAAVNALLAARAARAVLVADSSKIGHRAFATLGGPGLFDTLITDAGITAAQRAALTEAGYEVVVA
jgi:DeoR family transcriptional regulator of aga operon